MRAELLVIVSVAAVMTAGTCSRDATVSCESVVETFKTKWPQIYKAANSPAIYCFDRGSEAGGGGYAHKPNRIDINTRVSKLAREHGVQDKQLPDFWRNALVHEMGHAYAHTHGFDDRWKEWSALRGIPDELGTKAAQEDYAETFALWLGWHGPPEHYTRHHPGGYFDFQHAGGKPTREKFLELHELGWLPDK